MASKRDRSFGNQEGHHLATKRDGSFDNQVMVNVRHWLLLACILHLCSSQMHITIKPRILFLSEAKSSNVQITCQQLLTTTGNPRVKLAILRRPVLAVHGNANTEKLADMQESGATTTYTRSRSNYVASGDQSSRKLVLTIVKATCYDASFNYLCRGEQNQEVSDRIAVAVAPPLITLTATPARSKYSLGDTLILTCSTKAAIGLSNNPTTLGRWIWEYNDLGPWTPAPDKDIGKAKLTSRGCFQKSTPTTLTVRVKDLKSCSRRFRCYVTADVSRAVDDAQEHEVSMGFECDETSGILGTNSAVAIVGVLATLVVFVSAAIFIFMYSSTKRAMKKKARQKAMEMRLLSPMSPAQRDELLTEQMKEMAEKSAGILKPENRLDDDSSSVDIMSFSAATKKEKSVVQKEEKGSLKKTEKASNEKEDKAGQKKEDKDDKKEEKGSKKKEDAGDTKKQKGDNNAEKGDKKEEKGDKKEERGGKKEDKGDKKEERGDKKEDKGAETVKKEDEKKAEVEDVTEKPPVRTTIVIRQKPDEKDLEPSATEDSSSYF